MRNSQISEYQKSMTLTIVLTLMNFLMSACGKSSSVKVSASEVFLTTAEPYAGGGKEVISSQCVTIASRRESAGIAIDDGDLAGSAIEVPAGATKSSGSICLNLLKGGKAVELTGTARLSGNILITLPTSMSEKLLELSARDPSLISSTFIYPNGDVMNLELGWDGDQSVADTTGDHGEVPDTFTDRTR